MESEGEAAERSSSIEARALAYLRALLWNVAMYTEAACPDYSHMLPAAFQPPTCAEFSSLLARPSAALTAACCPRGARRDAQTHACRRQTSARVPQIARRPILSLTRVAMPPPPCPQPRHHRRRHTRARSPCCLQPPPTSCRGRYGRSFMRSRRSRATSPPSGASFADSSGRSWVRCKSCGRWR